MWTPVYYVRLVSLPAAIDGVTLPNDDGSFDIYLNADHSEAHRQESLEHELDHIMKDHFYQEIKSVAQLEQEANTRHLSAPPSRIPDVFSECPPGHIPYFPSLKSFGDYIFAMQEQADLPNPAG